MSCRAKVLGKSHLERFNLLTNEHFPGITPSWLTNLLGCRHLSGGHGPFFEFLWHRFCSGARGGWPGQERQLPEPQRSLARKSWQEDPRPLLSWAGFKERLPAQVGGGAGTPRETEAEARPSDCTHSGVHDSLVPSRARFSLC